MRKISAVVPVYNSAEVLPLLVARLEPVLRSCAKEFELILVNDGSTDAGWPAIVEFTRQHDWVRGINLMRNSGQHNALLCGIRAARYELLLTLDDDLQNPPEEIPKMLDALAEDIDVVYGSPESEVHGVFRNLASQITKIVLQGVLGAKTARMVGPFRVFRTDLRRAFDGYRGLFVNIDVLLTWGTTRFSAIRVQHDIRYHGRSNYTFLRLVVHLMNMLTGFSTIPLQLSTFIGLTVALAGIVLLASVIGRYLLYGVAVQGFVFLASIIITFSGTQLFTLGVIGEYLARMHIRLLDRPAYVVREKYGF